MSIFLFRSPGVLPLLKLHLLIPPPSPSVRRWSSLGFYTDLILIAGVIRKTSGKTSTNRRPKWILAPALGFREREGIHGEGSLNVD